MGVADAIAAYHARIEGDPEAAAEQSRWLEDAFGRAGVTFDGGPMRSFLRPHFLGRSQWERLNADGRRLLELAARVARQVFDGDAGRLCDFLGTPESLRPWVMIDGGEPDVLLSRLDAFMTLHGPRFIEINSDAPAGFGYGDRMAAVFLNLPLFQAFARDHHVDYRPSGPALVRAVLELWSRRSRSEPTVAIVDWRDVKTRADQEILRQAFAARGVECFLADPRDATLDEGRLHLAGRRADVVYRRGVLSELVEKRDEVAAFLKAYRAGAALFVNSFRCHLSEDKAFFAILTDEAFSHLMTEDERALVARVAPWTRRMARRRTRRGPAEVDLVAHVVEQRRALVLKPAHGYGGRSVLVGDQTPAEEWEAAVERSLDEPWVVQERVPIPEEDFPVIEGGTLRFQALKVNVNPFYVAGAESGAVTRASTSAVINVSAGGGSVPMFVL